MGNSIHVSVWWIIMKIGILGGTFNPPHIGHLILAEYVRDDLGLDKVIFIPCNLPPHKSDPDLPPADARLKMLRLAIGNNKDFKINSSEIARGGVSYTIDTLCELRKRHPQGELFFIIGSDLYKEFDEWKSPEEIKRIVQVVVVERENIDKRNDDFLFVDMPRIDVSSSFVRNQIKKGKSARYFLPPKVVRYIYKSGFYR